MPLPYERFGQSEGPRPVVARLTFLLLLFCGTICTVMIVSFMSYFLVEGLGHQPWVISG